MMKNISIIAFINIIFSIALIAIISTFLIFLRLDKEKYESNIEQRYEIIADSFLAGLKLTNSNEHLEKLYKKYNVKEITNREEKIFILNNAVEKSFKNTFLGRVRVFKLEQTYYIYVQELGYNIMLQDIQSRGYNSLIASMFFVFSLFVILLLYISLRRKFMPLKLLHKEIKRFSNGEQNLDIRIVNNDEIGKIAASFDLAVKNINMLSRSKTLFMRNMMHELKTPITKGMIITETIEDSKTKEILQRAFNRMNSIIKELATIERINTNTLLLNKEKTTINCIVKKAIEILMPECDHINRDIDNFDLFVDIPLFEIVLKNLIDNAIKFGKDSVAYIIASEGMIEIASIGEPLKNSLSEYTEAFYQDEKRKDGFGLGLYIVNEILRLHNFKLEYKYEEDKNIFFIDCTKTYN